MVHSRDLQKLEGVLSPSHLEVHHCPRIITQSFNMMYSSSIWPKSLFVSVGNGICTFPKAEQSKH